MKFIYWAVLIVGGSLLAWFLWRKVNPQTATGKPVDNRPTATITTPDGNLLAFSYKQVPQFGLFPRVGTNKKSIGINEISVIE